MLTSEEITKKLEENMEKIKQYGVKRMGLFGSYAKDEQKKESDIDILVEFEEGKKNFDNYMDLKFFLEELFQCNKRVYKAKPKKIYFRQCEICESIQNELIQDGVIVKNKIPTLKEKISQMLEE